jgi:hypothetical protein
MCWSTLERDLLLEMKRMNESDVIEWVPCSLLDSEEDDSDITETGDLVEGTK